MHAKDPKAENVTFSYSLIALESWIATFIKICNGYWYWNMYPQLL